MGAGKLPEQIGERFEAGRRLMVEEESLHPSITKSRATPATPKVFPERDIKCKSLSTDPIKRLRTLERRLLIKEQLREIQSQIDTLKSNSTKLAKGQAKSLDAQITSLVREAKRLRAMLPRRKRTSKRRR